MLKTYRGLILCWNDTIIMNMILLWFGVGFGFYFLFFNCRKDDAPYQKQCLDSIFKIKLTVLEKLLEHLSN